MLIPLDQGGYQFERRADIKKQPNYFTKQDK